MGNFGIKVAAPGVSVLTATDQDLRFTTKYSTLKIFDKGLANFTTDGSGNGYVAIPHNFGFNPAFFVFRTCTAGWTFLDANTHANAYFPIGVSNQWDDDNKNFALVAYSDINYLIIRAIGASANKTYYFSYFLLVDLAKEFAGSDNISLTSKFGFKVAKPGIDVKTAKEYELAYSSKYKSLQYYEESLKAGSMTLPAMWASVVDGDVEEGTYIDINHGLGYPPFFLAYIHTSNYYREIPYAIVASGAVNYEVSGFCDATKVRLSFWRKSIYPGGTVWSAETVNIKCVVFTEDLSESSL